VGRDSAVGIATRYRLDGTGIESRWGRDFPHPSRPRPVQRVQGLSRGKVAEAWRWPPTPSSTKVKERVQLYIYSPSGSSWPLLGWILPLPIYMRNAVAQWLRRCATNRKVAGSIPNCVIGIFHWHNPSDLTMALGSTQPLTEMCTRSISWGQKAAGA